MMGAVCGVAMVPQASVAFVQRCGKLERALDPGCACVPWCLCYCLAGSLTLRVQQLNVKCETKTKDNVFVTIMTSIQYQALREHAEEAFYRLVSPEAQIQSYVFDVVRATAPTMDLDRVFDQKQEIAAAVERELAKAMKTYGYEILQTLIVDVEPDLKVKAAMNEINAAQRLRMAASEKAEAEKIMQVKKAEGSAEAKYLAGVGIARQRQAIVDGLRESVLAFSGSVPGTTPKDVLDLVMMTQYFDTMKDIGAHSKASAIFIPHEPGNLASVAEQIRNGMTESALATKLVN